MVPRGNIRGTLASGKDNQPSGQFEPRHCGLGSSRHLNTVWLAVVFDQIPSDFKVLAKVPANSCFETSLFLLRKLGDSVC